MGHFAKSNLRGALPSRSSAPKIDIQDTYLPRSSYDSRLLNRERQNLTVSNVITARYFTCINALRLGH